MPAPIILSLLRDERGVSMVEYALLIGIVGIGIASSASIFESELSAKFDPARAAFRSVHCETLSSSGDQQKLEEWEADEKGIDCELQGTDQR